MAAVTSDDELLLILLRNLRNVAYTFGEGSSQHISIRRMVQEHLDVMKQKGLTTNLTQARQQENKMQGVEQTGVQKVAQQPDDLPELMETLASLSIQSKT